MLDGVHQMFTNVPGHSTNHEAVTDQLSCHPEAEMQIFSVEEFLNQTGQKWELVLTTFVQS